MPVHPSGADVDDPRGRAALEQRTGPAREGERGQDVGRERQLVTVGRPLPLIGHDAGVVDQHVEPLLVALEARRQRAQLRQAGHIAGNGSDIGAGHGRPDLLGGRLRAMVAAAHGQHPRSEPREAPGGGEPDARRGAGHQHRPPVHAWELLSPAREPPTDAVSGPSVPEGDRAVERGVDQVGGGHVGVELHFMFKKSYTICSWRT